MRLYMSAKTNIPDVYIDYIEVQLKNGQTVSLNWDESDISRSDDGFDARYKGVYFGEEYANGKIDELKDFQITDIGLYFETSGASHFQITEMEFEDNDKNLTFSYPPIPRDCPGLAGTTILEAPVQNKQKPSLYEQMASASGRAKESVKTSEVSLEKPDRTI